MTSETSYEDGRLIVTRVFDAPREAVFNAWIETSKVQLWWGCEQTTDVNSEIEPRIGGKYAHHMKLRNVGDHQHHGRITEYDPPKILAYELLDSYHNDVMTVHIEFIEENDQTRVRLTQDNLPDANKEFVIDGWSAGFEKLNQLLQRNFAK